VPGRVKERPRDAATLIATSIEAYRTAHRDYDERHGEIFNAVEQARLAEVLGGAVAGVGGGARRALDLGCGTGNLTAHLVGLGLETVAADVSPEFLDVVERRFADAPVTPRRIAGDGLPEFEDGAFDVAAAYSVLHHVPDYLGMVRELCRVVRPGGVIFIDHESAERVWTGDPALAELHQAVEDHHHPGWWHPGRRRWQRYLMPSKYVFAVRQRIDPLFWLDEADIHVWPADHIEWAPLEAVLRDSGAEILRAEDYLVFREGYPTHLYESYRDRCADMRLVVARKPAGATIAASR
jgi:SAM-dependent methyltransferase